MIINEDADMTDKAEVSVRNLVEFILRNGDIKPGEGGINPDAMAEGAKLHREIQKKMGSAYVAEVSLSETIKVQYQQSDMSEKNGGGSCEITVDGRADGIIDIMQLNDKEKANYDKDIKTAVDEIKTSYTDLFFINEMEPLHRAQAMCYAYIYAKQHNEKRIAIQLTYANLINRGIKRFTEVFDFEKLKEWFMELVQEYAKWVNLQARAQEVRDDTVKKLEFPFEYRPGQRDVAGNVYMSILHKNKLFIEAPTGVGKTVSVVFPAVKSMGEGLCSKLFYITAKTITRTVAENTFEILSEKGLKFRTLTITAKEKICPIKDWNNDSTFNKKEDGQARPECSPDKCPRAKGHYDRINDAIYDMLIAEVSINREIIEKYALKHMVCPFEMSLDVSQFADAIICDYNYVFDPDVCLKRFFSNNDTDGRKIRLSGENGENGFVVLVDEAHNLVERARDMYSASICREAFRQTETALKNIADSLKDTDYYWVKIKKSIDCVAKKMLAMKRECDGFTVIDGMDSLYTELLNLLGNMNSLMKEGSTLCSNDLFLNLYFDMRKFINSYENMDENYRIYADFDSDGNFYITVRCMDPATTMKKYTDKCRSLIYFSATLLPIGYYKNELGAAQGDYAIYAPSPFDPDRLLIMAATDASTLYRQRGVEMYTRIAKYIEVFVNAKTGNYMVFFPSYKMMEDVYQVLEKLENGHSMDIIMQKNNMKEHEREAFLDSFVIKPQHSHIGFCVLGGIFGEGIDLKDDKLIGAVIVGTGIPQVSDERNLSKDFFDEKGKNGFEYAYLYPGINKAMQAAGRVIRTASDKGAVLLLDYRFTNPDYRALLPREWKHMENVGLGNINEKLLAFWNDGVFF
jgi:DNA excision repair protein ERCC-2